MINHKRKYDNEGCIVIPDFFSESELVSIYPIIKMAHENWLKINHSEYLKNKMINSNYITFEDHFDDQNSVERKKLFSFIASNKMKDLVKTFVGKDAFFMGSQIFFNPKEHEKDGYWHRDTQYTGMSEDDQKNAMINEPVLHFHIPFIDDELFELVPGSHKRWDTKTEYDVRMNSNSSALDHSQNYDCKRGGIRIFSAHAIHRGKEYRSSPERFVFDPLFALRTEKSVKYYNPKGMPDESMLEGIDNRELFGV